MTKLSFSSCGGPWSSKQSVIAVNYKEILDLNVKLQVHLVLNWRIVQWSRGTKPEISSILKNVNGQRREETSDTRPDQWSSQ